MQTETPSHQPLCGTAHSCRRIRSKLACCPDSRQAPAPEWHGHRRRDLCVLDREVPRHRDLRVPRGRLARRRVIRTRHLRLSRRVSSRRAKTTPGSGVIRDWDCASLKAMASGHILRRTNRWPTSSRRCRRTNHEMNMCRTSNLDLRLRHPLSAKSSRRTTTLRRSVDTRATQPRHRPRQRLTIRRPTKAWASACHRRSEAGATLGLSRQRADRCRLHWLRRLRSPSCRRSLRPSRARNESRASKTLGLQAQSAPRLCRAVLLTCPTCAGHHWTGTRRRRLKDRRPRWLRQARLMRASTSPHRLLLVHL